MTDKKGFILNHQDFKPYGPEWEKEMMKLPKKAIIDLYRRACQEQPVSLPSEKIADSQEELWKELEQNVRAWLNMMKSMRPGEQTTAIRSKLMEKFTITRK